ncbi:hypothetical protein JCM14722_15000 [Pseudodesulfovibrio portus]|uniref:Uncharacterized protein n=1 Tax=Pseudodesulfovibrio portus TaxID=231439 RepID=A0ABM8ARA4_9BACT|nr:hypothetical protein JCM14722_15000 [Pseudodesulfovibrio portus]
MGFPLPVRPDDLDADTRLNALSGALLLKLRDKPGGRVTKQYPLLRAEQVRCDPVLPHDGMGFIEDQQRLVGRIKRDRRRRHPTVGFRCRRHQPFIKIRPTGLRIRGPRKFENQFFKPPLVIGKHLFQLIHWIG